MHPLSKLFDKAPDFLVRLTVYSVLAVAATVAYVLITSPVCR